MVTIVTSISYILASIAIALPFSLWMENIYAGIVAFFITWLVCGFRYDKEQIIQRGNE